MKRKKRDTTAAAEDGPIPLDLPEEIIQDLAIDWCDAHAEDLAKCEWTTRAPVAPGYYAFFGWAFAEPRAYRPQLWIVYVTKSGDDHWSYVADGAFRCPLNPPGRRAADGVWAPLPVPKAPTKADLITRLDAVPKTGGQA